MPSSTATNLTMIATCYAPGNLLRGPGPGFSHVRIHFSHDVALTEGYHTDPTRHNMVIIDLGVRAQAWCQAAEQVRWLGQVQVLYINMPKELWYFSSNMAQFIRHLMEKFWVLERWTRRLRVVIEGCYVSWELPDGREWLKVLWRVLWRMLGGFGA
jgi:hypothetical protein